MSTVNRADILKLSVSERILLVEDIWDSIAEAPDAIALTKAQELDARLDAYHKNPTEGSPWAIVRERVRQAGRPHELSAAVLISTHKYPGASPCSPPPISPVHIGL